MMPFSMSSDDTTRKNISSMNDISAVEVVFNAGTSRLLLLISFMPVGFGGIPSVYRR